MLRLILNHIIFEYCINALFHNILTMFSTPTHQFKVGQSYDMLEIFTIDILGEMSEFLLNCRISSIKGDIVTISFMEEDDMYSFRNVSIYNLRVPSEDSKQTMRAVIKLTNISSVFST